MGFNILLINLLFLDLTQVYKEAQKIKYITGIQKATSNDENVSASLSEN